MDANPAAGETTRCHPPSNAAQAKAMVRFFNEAQLPAIAPLPGSSELRRNASTSK